MNKEQQDKQDRLNNLLLYVKEMADLSHLADRQANPDATGVDLSTRAFRYIYDEIKEILNNNNPSDADAKAQAEMQRLFGVHSCDLPGCMTCGNPPEEN